MYTRHNLMSQSLGAIQLAFINKLSYFLLEISDSARLAGQRPEDLSIFTPCPEHLD